MEEIAPKIYFIAGKNKGIFPHSNSLLIKDEKTILIDSGTGYPIQSDILINSHSHPDHILENQKYQEIYIHKAAKLSSLEALKNSLGISGTEIEDLWTYFIGSLLKFGYKTKKFECNSINLGEYDLKIFFTPGHSPDHCCFLIDRVLFLSDIDLTNFGPWYGYKPSNIDDFIESIKKMMKVKALLAVTSHRGVVENFREELKNYVLKIYEREEKILSILERERKIEEIVDEAIIYKKFPEPQKIYRFFERVMIEKHVERLLKMKKVERIGEKFKAI